MNSVFKLSVSSLILSTLDEVSASSLLLSALEEVSFLHSGSLYWIGLHLLLVHSHPPLDTLQKEQKHSQEEFHFLR